MLVPPGSLREYASAAAHRECRARAFGAHVRQVPGWLRRTYRDAYLLSMLIAITSIKVQNNERKVKLAKAGAGSWMWKAPLLRRRRVSGADRWFDVVSKFARRMSEFPTSPTAAMAG